MDTAYLEKRERLNRAMVRLRVSTKSRTDLQQIIKLAREAQYKSLLGERTPSCKIPVGADETGQITYCGSPATQASHGIQHPLLVSISDPEPGPDGREMSNSEVLETFPKHPEYWQQIALRHEWFWNIERVPPQPKRPRSAATRLFACNSDDNKTFEIIEGGSRIQFPDQRTPSVFSSSDCLGLEFLEEQLFRLAYRAILSHQDVLISLQVSLSLPVQEQNPADKRLRTRLHRNRLKAVNPVLSAIERAKTEYDARLVGVRPLRLTHHLIPVRTAAAATVSDVLLGQTPSGAYEHIARTLLPTDVTNREHWLILSYPETDREWSPNAADQIQGAALASQVSESDSVDWMVWLLRNSTNAYVKPSHYRALPESAKIRVEERLAEIIIDSSVEWVTELEQRIRHAPPKRSNTPWSGRRGERGRR